MLNDIVTVVQLPDLAQVVLQSQSIDLFIKDPITHWIIIQDRSDISTWEAALLGCYTRHKLKLVQSWLGDSEYNRNDRNGYRNQQLLKLLASHHIQSESYLVLDSKNFFIQEQLLRNWKTTSGRPLVVPIDTDGPRSVWAKFVAEDLNILPTSHTYEVLTPFVMRTDIAQKCCQFDLVTLFNEKSKPFGYWESEFVFYSLIAKNFFQESVTEQMDFTQADAYYLTESDLNDRRLFMIHSVKSNLCIGIHRDVIAKMSSDQKQTVINWLVSHGFGEKESTFALNANK